MPSGQTVTSLQSNSNMIEDYTQTMLPPTAQSVANCFVAVQNDRQDQLITELITVSNQNNLLLISPSRQSNSGWEHKEVVVDGAPPSDIQKVISFYQNGTLYALAHYDSGHGSSAVMGMQRTLESDWGKMPFDPDLQNAIGLMRQTEAFCTASGVQYIYGVSDGYQPATFVLVGKTNDDDGWNAVYLEPAASPTATYRILPGYGGNELTVMTIDGANATFRGGSVNNGQLVWDSNAPVTHDLGQGAITADKVFAVPSTSGDQGFLLQGADNQLFHVAGYDSARPIVSKLTGTDKQPSGVMTVSVGRAQQGTYMVFAIDNVDQRLWLLRQMPDEAGGAVAFNPWVCLGNHMAALSCPVSMGTGPELLFVDLNAKIGHMCQQVEQGNWFTQNLASPAPATHDPVHTTTYSTEFVTAGDDGRMVPGSVLQITSDRPTVAIINSISYHIDNKTPAAVVSDAFGRVTVSTVSNSLVSPALKVTSSSMNTHRSEQYRSDMRVHQRLAGQDSTFPVDAAAMKAAGLMPLSVNGSDADALALKAQSLGTAAVNKHLLQLTGTTDANYRALVGTGFEIDFTKSTGMVRDLSPDEVLRIQADTLNLSGSDIWGDICNFFRHLIHDLERLIITFAEDVVYVVVKLADGFVHFVLKTLAEIGDCVEVLLQAIASIAKKVIDAIETAIRWLRALFSWDDILRTKKVISYYIDQSLKNLAQDFTTSIPSDLIALFATAKADVVTVFNNLELLFEKGVNFNAMGPASSSDPALRGGHPFEGVGFRSAYLTDSMQCNYVHSKMMDSSSKMSRQLRASGQTDSIDAEKILKIFEETFPTKELQESWEKIKAFSGHIRGAESFLEVVVLDVMEAVKDLVLLILTGIEAVLIALSEVVGLALMGLDALLEHVIQIPIISQIYKWFAKSDLTLLDLLSLLVAVPATLLYKVLYGGSTLKPPFTEAQVEEILSKPIPWPSFDKTTGSVSLKEASPAPSDSKDQTLADLLMASCFFYTIVDMALDIQTAQTYGNADNETSTPELGIDLNLVLGMLSIFLGIGMQAFAIPRGAFDRRKEGNATSADNWAIGTWIASWVPPLMDTVFLACTKSKKVTRMQTGGPLVSMCTGIVLIGLGAKTVAEMRKDTANYNTANQAAMLLPTFPLIFQPLVYAGTEYPVGTALQALLCGIDIAGDLGTGIAALVALRPKEASARADLAVIEGNARA